MFFGNPLLALVLVAVIYIIIDRRFIGALPDFIQPLRRWRKIAVLKGEAESSHAPGLKYYELGSLQVENGDMEDGRESLEKAHELIPDHPDIDYYLGVARIRTGALDAGKTVLENALRLNPKIKYGFPYVYLMEYSLKKQESAEQVEAYLEKIVEYGNPHMFYEAGVIFQKEGERKRAGEMFRQVQACLRRSPTFLKKQHRNCAIKAKIRSILLNINS